MDINEGQDFSQSLDQVIDFIAEDLSEYDIVEDTATHKIYKKYDVKGSLI
jgi:hypothetical protein